METIITFITDSDKIKEYDIREVHPFSTFNSQILRGRDVSLIVALSSDRAIGRNGDLPWHIPEDMARFKSVTMGHPVIMGRKTWESIPRRPLPGRRNMVVSHNPDYIAEGAEVFTSIEDALAACEGCETPFIIGGASIYARTLPYATRLYVTEVDTLVPDADAHFPEISADEWKLSEALPWTESKKGLRYRFLIYTRL